MIRFVSLPHSVTCNREKSIMLQRNKSEAWCLLRLEHYVEILPLTKKTNSQYQCTFFKLKLFRPKVDIKSVIRDYSLRNYVVNV